MVNRRPPASFELQNRYHEILELRRQILAVDLLPVELELSGDQQIEEVLGLAGLFEGENTVHNNEENNSE